MRSMRMKKRGVPALRMETDGLSEHEILPDGSSSQGFGRELTLKLRFWKEGWRRWLLIQVKSSGVLEKKGLRAEVEGWGREGGGRRGDFDGNARGAAEGEDLSRSCSCSLSISLSSLRDIGCLVRLSSLAKDLVCVQKTRRALLRSRSRSRSLASRRLPQNGPKFRVSQTRRDKFKLFRKESKTYLRRSSNTRSLNGL